MRVHLLHWHGRYTVIILEDGNLPHPQCPLCNILVPWKALNGRHIATAQCAKGGGAEGTEYGRRGDVGERGEDLPGLWKASCDSHLVKIPVTDLDGGGLRLVGGSREPLEGAEELGTYGKDTGTLGHQSTGLGDVIQGCGAGGPHIQVIDVGDDYGEASKATGGCELAVPTAGDSYGGGAI